MLECMPLLCMCASVNSCNRTENYQDLFAIMGQEPLTNAIFILDFGAAAQALRQMSQASALELELWVR